MLDAWRGARICASGGVVRGCCICGILHGEGVINSCRLCIIPRHQTRAPPPSSPLCAALLPRPRHAVCRICSYNMQSPPRTPLTRADPSNLTRAERRTMRRRGRRRRTTRAAESWACTRCSRGARQRRPACGRDGAHACRSRRTRTEAKT